MNPLESLRQSILNQLGSSDPPPDLGGSPKPRKRPRTSKYSRKELVAWAKLNGKPFGLNGNSKSLDILVHFTKATDASSSSPTLSSTTATTFVSSKSQILNSSSSFSSSSSSSTSLSSLSHSLSPKSKLALPQHSENVRKLELTSVASYELTDDHYFKGVKFSPDYRCILTAGDDRRLQLFEVPAIPTSSSSSSSSTTEPTTTNVSTIMLPPVLTFTESETIYDFSWYPRMTSNIPQTCVFASTSRNSPIHLFDAYTGKIRASYRAYNHYDELVSSISLSFNTEGNRLYAGFSNMIRIFDVGRPGKCIEERPTCKSRKDKDGQKGIISCIDFNPDCSGLYSAGTYDRSVWIYDDRSGDAVMSFNNAHQGGVTQVKWCPNGKTLCSGGRRDKEIVVWDIRGSTRGRLKTFKRCASTNQRFSFDITENGRYLLTGSSKRKVNIYDMLTDESKDSKIGENVLEEDFDKFPDCVNGITLGKLHAKGLLATCTGQRRQIRSFSSHLSSSSSDDSDGEDITTTSTAANRMELWEMKVL
jgi:telomerase Cajal body protein 1